MHRLVAFVSLLTHLAFIGFTVLGGFLAWMAPWVLFPHIASALWGARMAMLRTACPLSTAENWGRAGSGRESLDQGGFIAHYFEGRFYPVSWARRIEIAVGGVVLGSWVGFALH